MTTNICANTAKKFVQITSVAMLSLTILFGASAWVSADETDAKKILKSMFDYMAAQQSFSVEFYATLEVVTSDEQKLGIASSGTLNLTRPNKILFARTGGITDIELSFDGKELTLLGKNISVYAQLEVIGSIDHLINELKDTYNHPLPAADLLLSKSYDELMLDVVDVKDLGSGVVNGVVCDHLTFRTSGVDWQIWIAQGNQPNPCRFVITSKLIGGGPRYSVQLRNWQNGEKKAAADYTFNNRTKVEQVEMKVLKSVDDLPEHFMRGDTK